LIESLNNQRPGRPRKASEEELLTYEGLWVDTFLGLRDGSPGGEADIPARSGMFIRVSGQGPERLQISVAGESPSIIRQPKFSTTPDEIRQWQTRVKDEQDQFEHATFTPVRVKVGAIPPERRLWEALKRANSGTQVRRICGQSKIWLKPRLDFPSGGFIEYWPWRRILYRDADKFCRSKLDPRYPSRDQRNSGDYRRIEYFARVMAGLTLRFAPSTAVDMLRKMRHPEKCPCWRCILQIAPRYPMSLARYLAEGNWFEQR
jgi:hypothetical protein